MWAFEILLRLKAAGTFKQTNQKTLFSFVSLDKYESRNLSQIDFFSTQYSAKTKLACLHPQENDVYHVTWFCHVYQIPYLIGTRHQLHHVLLPMALLPYTRFLRPQAKLRPNTNNKVDSFGNKSSRFFTNHLSTTTYKTLEEFLELHRFDEFVFSSVLRLGIACQETLIHYFGGFRFENNLE